MFEYNPIDPEVGLAEPALRFIKTVKRKFVANESLTQEEQIFLYLLSGKGLTGPSCLHKFRIYRLASRVNELRHEKLLPVNDERLESRLALYYFKNEDLRIIKNAWSQA